MDGVDCDWCLVCDKKTNGATYCSEECRHTDLLASSSSSSASSSASSTGSSYFNTMSNNSNNNTHTSHPGNNTLGVHSPSSCSSSFNDDNYPMMLPLVRKQRTSIPNIYAHCTANPNQSPSLLSSAHFSAPMMPSHHHSSQSHGLTPPTAHPAGAPGPGSSAPQYPLFYATLNALRPVSPSGPIQDQQR
ncbi:hypothetical protein EMPS_00483 [Entomortierella parvispora]|uniref:Uncharacterized protein n=1 Tax=Entomortierella parvispora TaxID=205924 RepID=A0A9P3LRW7_9FUNG|nr:hypothetical protein EMPS_00483 [Entomortierella parvispora]